MARARTGILPLCLWVMFWLPWPAFAQEIGVAWLEDATGSLAVADLAQPGTAARFRATGDSPLNFGLSRSAAALLKQADRAMYAAKQAGRNGYRRGAG